jgi:dissimilatory sulfite reductase (desulfoviridin) alpha/beta subunit
METETKEYCTKCGQLVDVVRGRYTTHSPALTTKDVCGRSGAFSMFTLIGMWHDGNSKETLSEFIGMTTEQYASWGENPRKFAENLRKIQEFFYSQD